MNLLERAGALSVVAIVLGSMILSAWGIIAVYRAVGGLIFGALCCLLVAAIAFAVAEEKRSDEESSS